jgi:hypothetical protein
VNLRGVLVEVPHVKHLGKSRFRLLHGLGLAYRVICARRWLGRNGPFGRVDRNGTIRRGRRGPTKRWSNWRGAKSGDRPEWDGKRLQGSPNTAAAHNRPDGAAVQVIARRTRD